MILILLYQVLLHKLPVMWLQYEDNTNSALLTLLTKLAMMYLQYGGDTDSTLASFVAQTVKYVNFYELDV